MAAYSPLASDLREDLCESGRRFLSVPLIPAALVVTLGAWLDRTFSGPLLLWLCVAAATLLAFAIVKARQPGLALIYLAGSGTALGAAWHHAHRSVFAANDIAHVVTNEARLVRLRGTLLDEPVTRKLERTSLISWSPTSLTTTTLAVDELRGRDDDWQSACGRVRLTVPGPLEAMHAGDVVEVIGWLKAPRPPANPGERDRTEQLRDQRIRAEMRVRHTADAVVRLEQRWHWSLFGWLAFIRGWGQRRLRDCLPSPQAGLAEALILGEGSAMTTSDWDRFIHTGVVHVLAISGQHLVVLVAASWWVLRLVGVRRTHGAAFVAIGILTYALLTGGRPPVMRAAIMIIALCGAVILRRPTRRLNILALAWLLLIALSPTDLFTAGCQLSFLAVIVLGYGADRWLKPGEAAPLQQLIDETRPGWERGLRQLSRLIGRAYLVTLMVWLAVAPLAAAWHHTVAPVGLLIGPVVVALTSIALVAGFALLLAELLGGWLSFPFALLVRLALGVCDALVHWADWPGWGFWYVGTIPVWWLAGFYFGLLIVLIGQPPVRTVRFLGVAGLAWGVVGLLGGAVRPSHDELRVTFLAVGHGGCVVMETPDGRTLLYDAGSLAGPDVARRIIAPYLWHRGIRRIDELILSHADLDHFNAVPALTERFAVGQVTLSPSFADKSEAGVRWTLDALDRAGIARRIVRAGDRLSAGSVECWVLHPPSQPLGTNENARSLTVLVRHEGHQILLTGDLEGAGLDRVVSLPAVAVDVLMAPHHGSRQANRAELAAWASPRLVVAARRRPEPWEKLADPYTPRGAKLLDTGSAGAVTIRSHRSGLLAETFLTGERFVLRHGR